MARSCLSLLAFICLICSSLSGQQTDFESHTPYIKGKVLFKIHPDYSQACQASSIELEGWNSFLSAIPEAKIEKMFPNLSSPLAKRRNDLTRQYDIRTIYILSFPGEYPVETIRQYVQRHPAVVYAEPWYIQQTFYNPNDIAADTSGGISEMWYLEQIRAREAWDIERNDTTVKVGVVDSGTWSDHPDLKDNLAYNYDDPLDGIDNDFDGYIDNYYGWDFGGPSLLNDIQDNQPSVGNVHGLWVTGIIGATADNLIGMPSVCFNCKYLPIKAASDDFIQGITHGYQGIIYAIEQGAEVVNCSWGSTTKSLFAENIINYATQVRGAAIVAACGNSGANERFYPAGYKNVISVANSSFGDELYTNSTYHYSVDVAAPGWRILSTFGANDYSKWGGTSAASPVAAGGVALVKAHFPELSGFQAGQRLRMTADYIDDVNPGKENRLGNGRVNLLRALTDPAVPSVRQQQLRIQAQDGTQNFDSGDSLEIDVWWVNHLAASKDLRISLSVPTSYSPLAELIDGEFIKGKSETDELFQTSRPFKIKLKGIIPPDFTLYLRLTYTDTVLGYQDFEYIDFPINPSSIVVKENFLGTNFNGDGQFGVSTSENVFLNYKEKPSMMLYGGFMVGDSPQRLSDGVNNNGESDPSDFAVVRSAAKTGNIESHFEGSAIFNDSNAPNPLNIDVQQDVYAYKDAAVNDAVFFKYTLINNQASTMANLYAGMYTLWGLSSKRGAINFDGIFRNTATYDESYKLVYAFDTDSLLNDVVGMALLSEQDFKTTAFVRQLFPYVDEDDTTHFTGISTTPNPVNGTKSSTAVEQWVGSYIGAGPITLFSGQSDTVAIALLAGDDLADLKTNVEAARIKYYCDIQQNGPQQSFILDSSPLKGSPVSFSDQNGQIDSYFWDFGDGTTSAQSNPTHTFDEGGFYEVQLTVERGICRNTFRETIWVNFPVTLAEPIKEEIRLFPNPSKGLLQIETSEDYQLDRVELSDSRGRLIWKSDLLAASGRVELEIPSRVENGLYFIRLFEGDKNWPFKVIIQR
ncbi:MAG: S8 family serine peptidase [Bacteroidota bacterium]